MDNKDNERIEQVVTRCRELGLDIYDIASILEKKDPEVFVGSLAYALAMACIATKTDIELILNTTRSLHNIINKNSEKYIEKMKETAQNIINKMDNPDISMDLNPFLKSKKDTGNN